MKRLLLAITVLLIATTAFAQSNTVSVSLLRPQFSGVSASADGETIPVGFDSRTGFAIEANRRSGHLGFGIGVSRFTAPASASLGASRVSVGSLALTPITADVAFHGNGGRVDPYIGAGLAYVTTGNLRSGNLDSIGLGTISVGNDFTYSLKAGLAVNVRPNLAIKIDGRYMPVSVNATAADQTVARLRFKTLTYGAGLQWNF